MEMRYNYSGHTDFYNDFDSVRLLLRLNLLMACRFDVTRADANTVGSVPNLLHSVFSYIIASLNLKPVTQP